ncbi:hypothetical protein BFJ69_g14329 [Fusarium oxysporum]|uniref:Uncharacterized protein n=1 Tax=Fusarium oxysporum TaxID=5507 RepID=A0A420MHW4_FUSOX|nr:hypothetical protein BFJ69_g14329 [Fusarium oxysporum]
MVQKVQASMVFSRFDRLFGDYRPIKARLIVPDLMTTFLADGALGAEQPLRAIDKYLDAVRAQEKPRDLRKCERTLSTDEQRLVECYDMLEDLVLVAEHKCIFTTDYFQIGNGSGCTYAR